MPRFGTVLERHLQYKYLSELTSDTCAALVKKRRPTACHGAGGGGIERLICATSPGTKCKRPTGPARPTSVACAQCPLEWPAPRRLARQPSQLSGPPPPLGGE